MKRTLLDERLALDIGRGRPARKRGPSARRRSCERCRLLRRERPGGRYESAARELGLVGAPGDDVRSHLRAQRLRVLPCTLEHVFSIANLADHHRDPFDRLLVAQAIAENLTILSSDERLRAYDIDWLDARR